MQLLVFNINEFQEYLLEGGGRGGLKAPGD